MSCLDNIISIPDGCSDTPASLSGFAVTDLPGITIKQSASIASEKFMSGINLIRDAKRRAILQVRNDVIAFLNGSGYVAKSVESIWSTLDKRDGSIKVATDIGDYRGIVIKAQQKNCLIKKLHIPYIYVKADYTGALVLRVEDGDKSYPYTFDSVAGSISKVVINFTAETDEVHLLIPDNVDVYSVLPNCSCGGSNTPKSKCASVRGYYNSTETKTEGYGIWADVQCRCNYDHLLCQLATDGLLGEIVLFKTGINIMEERLKTDRLNYFTTYGLPEAKQTRDEWTVEYNEKWNVLIGSLPAVLPRMDKCGCIECGSYRIANV